MRHEYEAINIIRRDLPLREKTKQKRMKHFE